MTSMSILHRTNNLEELILPKGQYNFDETAARPIQFYWPECWACKRNHIDKINITNIQMLQLMCDYTRRD